MNTKKVSLAWLLMLAAAVLVLQASNCEVKVAPEDHCQMTVVDDLGEFDPMVSPECDEWWVTASSINFEHPDSFYDAMDAVNDAFGEVLHGDIDDEGFAALSLLEPQDEARACTILVWVGALPDPQWDEPGPGGICHLYYDLGGSVFAAEIVIDFEQSWHEPTCRDRLKHEFGHAPPLFLAHDDSSMDMGSCMASPPEYDCEFTEHDKNECGL